MGARLECCDLNVKCVVTYFSAGDPVLESHIIESLKNGTLQEEVDCFG